jgi:NAD(P)-dependent dehydrogenase (short-subunit alcohol dehydrogenase family)
MAKTNSRTAIVTGAGKRVGLAIAEALLADGWAVVAHVRSDGDPVPDGARKVAADLAEPDCAGQIFAALDGLPPPRLLVNNAARFMPDSVEAFDPGEFDRHMAVNVRTPALLISAFAGAADGEGDRLVVNILDAKLAAPNPDFCSYTLSKMALAGLTELAARALAPRGIRVNAISPALMLRSGEQSEENFRAAHAYNPLGRGVEPEEVVRALRYLLDSRTVTGQTVTIDGGQRFMGLGRDVQYLDLE